MKFLSDIRLLLLGIWLGAAVFFIAVAQSAFAVLPEREMAGAVVNRTLSILNYGGLAIGVLLLVTSLVVAKNANRFLVWGERLFLLIVTIACAVGQFVFGFMFLSLRLQMGRPIDQVAVDDPLRLQFNALHQYSEWVLMAAMIAALIAFFVMANRKSSSNAASNETTTNPFDFEKPFTK